MTQAPPPTQPSPVTQIRQEQTEQVTTVAQEVLLVPRTVYVPYVHQTPVTTARLTMSTTQNVSATLRTSATQTERGPELRQMEQEPLNAPAPPAPAAPAPPSCKNDAIVTSLDRLATRLDALENRLRETDKMLQVPAKDQNCEIVPQKYQMKH
ncbi:MAG: hypothetical protein U1D30_24140 [Planctomycetota bacterium]